MAHPSLQELTEVLPNLSGEDLLKLKEAIQDVLRQRFKDDLGQRESPRVKVKFSGTCLIEREKEFFSKDHKISILDLSTQGLMFQTTALVYPEDILEISFRLPSNGERKTIDCKAMRVREIKAGSETRFEVGAKAVDKQTVKAYRDMLAKRSS